MSDSSPGSRPASSDGLFQRLRTLFGGRSESVRETIEELIEATEQADEPIGERERELLLNILRMRDTTVDDVMVPRGHIVAVEIGTPFGEVEALMAEAAHSRLPVFRDTLDDVVGMVHIKDVLAARKAPLPLERLLRPTLFVPPSMPVLDLLIQMRAKRTHLALVVDEYGGIDGLVTIEDVVEQIVGEIEDEHDETPAPQLERRPDGSLVADAGTPLDDIETLVGRSLRDEDHEDVDTLAGLVSVLAGRVPEPGEVVFHASGIEFEVVAGDARRVERVRLRNLPPPPDQAA